MLFSSIPARAGICLDPGLFVLNEFFLEGEVTSIAADSAATAVKLEQLGVEAGTFEFGAFSWDCDAPDLEPGNANLGRYAGDFNTGDITTSGLWFLDVILLNPPSALVDLAAFFESHEILVGNDLPPGLGGPFDAGGDGYAFLGTNPGDPFSLPPWLEWTDAELLLLDPTGQALSDTALPLGPPDLSLFPVQSFVLRGFDADESGAFSIAGRVDVLRVPEPTTALLFVSGLVGLVAAHRWRQ